MSGTRLDPGSASGGAPVGGVGSPGRAQIAERTLRVDRWWLQPLITFTLLVIWLLYALVRTSMQRYYFVEEYHYLTPFYSPCVTASCVPEARHLGTWMGELPPLVPYAFFLLPILLGFRLTCYYYRKAYYRSFWLSPPACAVAEPHARYTGETRFPLILQNVHRYFLYFAVPVAGVLTLHAVEAFHFPDGWGVGLGSLIFVINSLLIWAFTLSCNSCRHLCGGGLNLFSKA